MRISRISQLPVFSVSSTNQEPVQKKTDAVLAQPVQERFAIWEMSPEDIASPEKRQYAASKMMEHLKKWPSLSAVISTVPEQSGSTTLLVASPENAIAGSELRGVYEVVGKLCGSESIKKESKKYPTRFSSVRPFDNDGKIKTISLPGVENCKSISLALEEGGIPNQWGQLKGVIENLPKGKRVAILLGGPSGAGKTTLIEEIKKLAGDRKVVPFNGDMYFRDMDDPQYPLTSGGTPYWDSVDAMHIDDMLNDITKLIRDGKGDIPVYDFTAKVSNPPNNPDWKDSGKRVGYNSLELGSDDILVIDSLHATNNRLIEKLTSLKQPFVNIYLDTEGAEVRLLRRIIRDYETRSSPAETTLKYWDLTTFPGEVEFIRPTLLNFDPAQDLFLKTQFPKDIGLTRKEIDLRITLLANYGLGPTFEAVTTGKENIELFARKEAKRLTEIIESPLATEKDKSKALLKLNKIKSSPCGSLIFNPTLQHAA